MSRLAPRARRPADPVRLHQAVHVTLGDAQARRGALARDLPLGKQPKNALEVSCLHYCTVIVTGITSLSEPDVIVRSDLLVPNGSSVSRIGVIVVAAPDGQLNPRPE